MLACQKFCKVLLTRLLQNGEITTVHNFNAKFARFAHKPTKMRIEFGCSACNVEGRDLLVAKKIQHQLSDVAPHLLSSSRAGIDVTMETGLVATIANIDLQRFQLAAAYRGKRNLVEQRKRVAH